MPAIMNDQMPADTRWQHWYGVDSRGINMISLTACYLTMNKLDARVTHQTTIRSDFTQ